MYAQEARNDRATVLKGVVRSEKIQDPSYYVNEILRKVDAKVIKKLYGIIAWSDTDDFLEKVARRMGKLKKGNQPDGHAASKIVLFDWQKGRIPFYTLPPKDGEGNVGKEPAKKSDEEKKAQEAEKKEVEAAAEEPE